VTSPKKNTRLNCVSPTDASAVSRDARRQVALAGSFAIWIFSSPKGHLLQSIQRMSWKSKMCEYDGLEKRKTFLSIAAIQ